MLCLDYSQELPSIRRLITLSGRAQWNSEDIEWAPVPDKGGLYERILEWHGIRRRDYIQRLPPKKTEALARQLVAFDFSQILHGEQAALMLAGQLTTSVDDLDARIFAANQARDEARHVMAVREIVGRLGPVYECGPLLYDNIQMLLECDLWPKQVLGLQLFLEARALLSFRQHMMFVRDPVFMDATKRIERDEAHHVAFGVQYLRNGVNDLDHEMKEELIEYAKYLNENLWVLIEHEQYRAVFEEVDLDFVECYAEPPSLSFLSPQIGIDNQRRLDTMMVKFGAWFAGAIQKVGLSEALSQSWAGKAEEPDDAQIELPWTD